MSNVNIVHFYDERDKDDINRSQLNSLEKSEHSIKLLSKDSILLGHDTESEIESLIDSADIIILFYSADFYASGLYEKHIKRILKKRESSNTQVFAVRFKRYNHAKTFPDFKLDFFPSKEGEAFMDSGNIDAQWEELIRRIQTIAQGFNSEHYKFSANLCNRQTQYNQLRNALRKQTEKMAQTNKLAPLICFIHGSPEENINEYQVRLLKNDLKNLLKCDKPEYRVIRWARDKYEAADFPEFLRQRLSEEVLRDPFADTKDVVSAIGDSQKPYVFLFRMETAFWKTTDIEGEKKEARDFIKDFVKFWNELPSEHSQNKIIICFFFLYNKAHRVEFENEYEERNKKAELFFSRPGTQIQTADNSSHSEFRLPEKWFPPKSLKIPPDAFEDENFENVCGIILDKLPSVSYFEAKDWVDEKYSDSFYYDEILDKLAHHYKSHTYKEPEIPVEDETSTIDENYDPMSMKILTSKLIYLLCETNRY